MSRSALDAPVFRRRRHCLECRKAWPTTESLDVNRFTREAKRLGVDLADLDLGVPTPSVSS